MKTSFFVRPAGASSERVHDKLHLDPLDILLFDTGSADTVSALPLLKPQVLIRLNIVFGSVNILLEDRLGFECLKFSLEAVKGTAVSAAIGATAGVGEGITIVLGLISWSSPRAFPSA